MQRNDCYNSVEKVGIMIYDLTMALLANLSSGKGKFLQML